MSQRRYCCPVTCLDKTTLVSATTGSDRCGQINSADHPFRTIDAAARATPAGSQLLLESGTYRLSESLLDKAVYAEPGVILQLETATGLDGIVALVGYAVLQVLKPIEYIRLGLRNAVGSTKIQVVSVLDAATTVATFVIPWDEEQVVSLEVKDTIRTTANNTTVFDLRSKKKKSAAEVARWKELIKIVTRDVQHTQGGNIVTAEHIHFDFEAVQALTTGIAFRLTDTSAKIMVDQVGSPSFLPTLAVAVNSSDLEYRNYISFGRVLATQGAQINGGTNQVNIRELGTPACQVQNGATIEGHTDTNVKVQRAMAKDDCFRMVINPDGSRIVLNVHQAGTASLPVRRALIVEHNFPEPNGVGSTIDAAMDRVHASETGVAVMGAAVLPLAVSLSGTYWTLVAVPLPAATPTIEMKLRELIRWNSPYAAGNLTVTSLNVACGCADARVLHMGTGKFKLFASDINSDGDMARIAGGDLQVSANTITAAGNAFVCPSDSQATVTVSAIRSQVERWAYTPQSMSPPLGTFIMKSLIQQLQVRATVYEIPLPKRVEIDHDSTTIESMGALVNSAADGAFKFKAKKMTAAYPGYAVTLSGPAPVTLSGLIINALGGVVRSSGSATSLTLQQATLTSPVGPALSYDLALLAELFLMNGNQVLSDPGIDPAGATPTIKPATGRIFVLGS